ncbi:hypothetical protein EV292_106202 [Sphingomonas sp. BK235]|nr:hypothetical protein EV292_106202 [Sphingomonas sp. BK235]
MTTVRQKLTDVLNAGHAETALVGVPISLLRELVAALPSAGDAPATPVVAAIAAGAVA